MRLGPAEVRFTGTTEGDLGHAGRWVAVADVDPLVHRRRQAVLDRPWSWPRQVHGADVVAVDEPGDGAGEEGDAVVSAHPGAALVVLTADCAPVALASDDGIIGVAHAGWRGLLAGVLPATVAAMRSAGAEETIRAALGPCIRPACYEFSSSDLDRAAVILGEEVRGVTSAGGPALDVPSGVRVSLASAGVELVHDEGICTACQPGYFSHRARGDLGRQATVVWLP